MWLPEDMAPLAAIIDPDVPALSADPQPDFIGVAPGAAFPEPAAAAAEAAGPAAAAVADVPPDPAGQQPGQLAAAVVRLQSQVGRCLSLARLPHACPGNWPGRLPGISPRELLSPLLNGLWRARDS
jgi:hypothetical protein